MDARDRERPLHLPLLLLREPKRHEVEAGPSAPFKVVLSELNARRGWIIPLFLGQTTVVMADAAAGIWVSPVLERFYHLQPGEFAGWLGALVFATGIVGSIIGGLVADMGQKSHIRGGLMIGAIAAAFVGVPSALFPIMPGVGTVAIAIGSLMLAGSVTAMVASVALTVWLPNELRGLGIGAFIAVAGLIGFRHRAFSGHDCQRPVGWRRPPQHCARNRRSERQPHLRRGLLARDETSARYGNLSERYGLTYQTGVMALVKESGE